MFANEFATSGSDSCKRRDWISNLQYFLSTMEEEIGGGIFRVETVGGEGGRGGKEGQRQCEESEENLKERSFYKQHRPLAATATRATLLLPSVFLPMSPPTHEREMVEEAQEGVVRRR